MDYTLSLTGSQHAALRQHLFPGDGKEAVAILLCGRRAGECRHRLLTRKIHLIPLDQCSVRSEVTVAWPTDLMIGWLEEAATAGLSVVKVHSHPTSALDFSHQDDLSDRDLFPCIDGWMPHDAPHASAIMLPDGRMFGRVVDGAGGFTRLRLIAVAGDDLHFWRPHDFGQEPLPPIPEFAGRHAKAFGAAMTRSFGELSVAVIGASGLGSPTIVQLGHLGFKRVVMVDDDRIRTLNLNRILHATANDADDKRLKVEVLARAIEAMGLGTKPVGIAKNLYSVDAIKAVADCDLIIGCVDTSEGRFVANLIANFYILPYIDIGVTLEAEEDGEIAQVCGYVHYLQPGGSSLLSRKAINMDDVRAEGIRRQNPIYYEEQRRAGYIKGVVENRPAVISVNMAFSALAVNELIGRVTGFRERPNRDYAKIALSLSELAIYLEAEPTKPCAYMSRQVGRGDVVPLLDLAELTPRCVS